MQKCTLALGCFWMPEENFKNKPGITDTEVGYAGGENPKVTYKEVCKGNTGHAEVVKLTFDEKIVSYEKILDLFFKMHDPTQKDMQYPDIGKQYRSEIFYENEDQKLTAVKIKNELNKKLDGKIETNISKIKNYCKAEEYHQKYIEKNQR
jgi:peptide-methionine (S)-S-oxide reductase